MGRIAIAAIFSLLATAAFADGPVAIAADLQPFTEASATRASGDAVQLHLAFEGGACQGVDAPQPGAVSAGVLAVTIPTQATAEICTMQIVPIAVDVTVPATAEVTALQVIVLGTNGEAQFGGRVDIAK
jgi:hypothetical protein